MRQRRTNGSANVANIEMSDCSRQEMYKIFLKVAKANFGVIIHPEGENSVLYYYFLGLLLLNTIIYIAACDCHFSSAAAFLSY